MPEISVIINTKCVRKEQLFTCIKSIQDGTYKDFEIIVVQQGRYVLKLPKTVKTYKAMHFGTGFAKNIGIKHAKGKYIAFTDDDCLVGHTWLHQIVSTFENNPKVISIFGKVLPYKSKDNEGLYCPATVVARKYNFYNEPTYHGEIGSGNNMAFRSRVFNKIGGFKKWLGPGSIGVNADDAEMAMRLLHNRLGILYNPDAVVYHNRWLDKEEYIKQKFDYTLGEIACYTYYAFKKNSVAIRIMKGYFYNQKNTIKATLKKIIDGNACVLTSLLLQFKKLMMITYVFLIGAIFSIFTKHQHV